MSHSYKLQHQQDWFRGVGFKYLTLDVLKRSLILSMIIGVTLTLLNQPSVILGQAEFKWVTTIFMFITPFIVITLSQLVANEQARIDWPHGQNGVQESGFLNILFNHNIATRAFFIALAIGLINCILMGLISLYKNGNMSLLSTELVLQFFILPFIFGVFSQTMTLKRQLKLAVQASAKNHK